MGQPIAAAKKKGRAKDCLEEAIKVFKMLDNDFYLTQAKEALESMLLLTLKRDGSIKGITIAIGSKQEAWT